MTYTQAQIDRANAANLEDFLRAQGETLVRSGKEYRWKAHDSLTVCGNKWFRHSQSKGGYPVDFVMEFYGKSFPEAVQMLTGELGEVQPEADPTPSPAFRLPLRNVTNANILNYLTQERKLSPSLVNFFVSTGDIYEDAAHHNVVFVGRDADGHPRYASSRGIYEKFRQDAAGAEKAFGFAHRGTDKQLLVFEAPIDLLSFIKSAALKKCRNVWMQQLLAITSWAIPLKLQKRAWPRLPCCGRTSSITPGHVRFMMPTAKPGTVRDFWKPTGKKSRCIRLQKLLLMKLD